MKPMPIRHQVELMKLGFITFIILAILACLPAFAVSDSTVIKTFTEQVIDTTSTEVLADRLNRNYLRIHNKGATQVLLKYCTAHTGSEGITLAAGEIFTATKPPRCKVFLKSSSLTNNILIVEGAE